MEIYREVCTALERLYERNAETSGNEAAPVLSQSTNDSLLNLSPDDASFQVNITF